MQQNLELKLVSLCYLQNLRQFQLLLIDLLSDQLYYNLILVFSVKEMPNLVELLQLFREAAEIIVTAQQGSASLLQRKLKLGYNRAGRLIDQLEAAGIVGGFEGSKARQVLIPDFVALDQLLENENK
jgi:DNA segregation ATPase FtsK/SpoIIIE-like protein